MHDYSGLSPSHDDVAQETSLATSNDDHHIEQAAAMGLQELSSSNINHRQQPTEMLSSNISRGSMQGYEIWNTEEWPIWGEQQFLPFAAGGLPFDFDPGIAPM